MKKLTSLFLLLILLLTLSCTLMGKYSVEISQPVLAGSPILVLYP